MAEKKETGIAYALWAVPMLSGIHGLHRFYLGHVGMGILYFCTFGLCGIGWIIDAVLLPGLVEQENAIAQLGQGHAGPHGQYAQQTRPRGITQQFRPAPEYRQASGAGGTIALVFAIVFGVFAAGCFGFMILAAFGAKEQQSLQHQTRQAEMERRRAHAEEQLREAELGPVKARGERSKHPEVAQLQDAAAKLHAVVDRKLTPLIERFQRDLNNAREELRVLRPQLKESESAKFKAKKLIEEAKELKGYLSQLETRRDGLIQQADQLDFTIRSLDRKLEVAQFLGKEDKAELEQLLARSQTLVEEAQNAKLKPGSLEEEVENAPKAPVEGKLDPALERALDSALDGE